MNTAAMASEVSTGIFRDPVGEKDRIVKRSILVISIALTLVAVFAALFLACAPQFGATTGRDELAAIMDSDNFREGRFYNMQKTQLESTHGGLLKSTVDYLLGGQERTPAGELPVVSVDCGKLRESTQELRVTWLGHSTSLIELDGLLILTDPMFGGRASPIPFLGPKRFSGRKPVTIEQLPEIDIVVISHDHYDHLDYRSILKLKDKVRKFYVPLGVEAHLEKWGVDRAKVEELDWWQESTHGPLKLIATPSRHFSGRGLSDRNRTLWCSWVIQGSERKVFFGGDSGYSEAFAQIGQRFGPFDLTMLECGAYSQYWPDVHMMPEETVQAHKDLGGGILMPIHWAGFNLSLHSWTEPVERLLAETWNRDVIVAVSKIGEMFEPDVYLPQVAWWEQVTGKATVARTDTGPGGLFPAGETSN